MSKWLLPTCSTIAARSHWQMVSDHLPYLPHQRGSSRTFCFSILYDSDILVSLLLWLPL